MKFRTAPIEVLPTTYVLKKLCPTTARTGLRVDKAEIERHVFANGKLA